MSEGQFIGLIDVNGNYYEAEHNITGATEVPIRPSSFCTWDGSSWVEQTAEREEYELNYNIKLCEHNVQAILNEVAKDHGYDNIISACMYASTNNPYQLESQKFVLWTGLVWEASFVIMNDITNGTRSAPTKEELIAELPVLSL